MENIEDKRPIGKIILGAIICVGVIIIIGFIADSISNNKSDFLYDDYQQEDTDSSDAGLSDMELSQDNQFEDFMKENDISLTAKDVEFDMANNVDKPFAIEGTAELSDYYNYGYDDSLEKDYFVMRVSPYDGGDWYIYCHRDSFSELFDILKEESFTTIRAKCKISQWNYEEGQDNQAMADRIQYAK